MQGSGAYNQYQVLAIARELDSRPELEKEGNLADE